MRNAIRLNQLYPSANKKTLHQQRFLSHTNLFAFLQLRQNMLFDFVYVLSAVYFDVAWQACFHALFAVVIHQNFGLLMVNIQAFCTVSAWSSSR